MSVVDLLDWIERRRLIGELILERGASRRKLRVANGTVENAASNDPAEFLAQILINCGYLSEEQLRDAYIRVRAGEIALGQLLVDEGLVPEDALRAALELKIREGVYEALSWPDGQFAFEKDVPGDGKVEVRMAVPLRDCIVEGESRARAWRAVREQVPGDQAHFKVIDQAYAARVAAAGPGSQEARLLADLARGLTVRDVELAHHALPFAIGQQLAELTQRGIIRLAADDSVLVPLDPPPDDPEAPAELSPEAAMAAAQARAKGGDKIGALALARRALEAAPADEAIKKAHQTIERSVLVELTRTLLSRFHVPRLTRPSEEIEELDLTPEERYFVGRIDGRWDLLSLMRVSPLREVDALITIQRLHSRGLITLEEQG